MSLLLIESSKDVSDKATISNSLNSTESWPIDVSRLLTLRCPIVYNALSSKEWSCELVGDVQSESTVYEWSVTGPGFVSISPQVTSKDAMNSIKIISRYGPSGNTADNSIKIFCRYFGMNLTRVQRLIHVLALNSPTAALY